MENICMTQKADSEVCSYGQLVIGSFITTMSPRILQSFFEKHQITQVTQSPYSPDWVPHDFWLSSKLKSPLKGKRLQTIDEIHLMVIERTVWGPKVPSLKGTEASLSYVQCFLYLVSSINVSIFHSTWLETFWTDFIIYRSSPLPFWHQGLVSWKIIFSQMQQGGIVL